jgi:hypothetical protein
LVDHRPGVSTDRFSDRAACSIRAPAWLVGVTSSFLRRNRSARCYGLVEKTKKNKTLRLIHMSPVRQLAGRDSGIRAGCTPPPDFAMSCTQIVVRQAQMFAIARRLGRSIARRCAAATSRTSTGAKPDLGHAGISRTMSFRMSSPDVRRHSFMRGPSTTARVDVDELGTPMAGSVRDVIPRRFARRASCLFW